MPRPLADAFRAARRDPQLVVIEGFHALKHALRFGAALEQIAADREADLDALASELAPELAPMLAEVPRLDSIAGLTPRTPRTGIVAIARRPRVDPTADVLASPAAAPVVFLESPRTMGNLGACVRVAAAAGAAGLLTSGPHDPWHADAVRGGAGLQFALPVARLDAPSERDVLDALVAAAHDAGRPLIALDPDGDELTPHAPLPSRGVLAFGTERDGLTPELLARASARVRLPMQAGVSSLNLATSVAATLYAWRLTPTG